VNIWSYGVTTVPERFHDTLPRTLASLRSAGFDQPRLFIDGAGPQTAQWYEDQYSLPVSARYPRLGLAANWMLSAAELYLRNPQATHYALFQDDLIACQNIRAYLEAIPYPPNAYLNLFTFLDNERLLPQAPQGWFEAAELHTARAQRFHGRQQQAGRGALALVFSRDALTTLFMQPHLVTRPQSGADGAIKIDGGIVEAMNRAGYREYIHNPSLVAHTGHRSTKENVCWHKNAQTFPGENFDALTLLTRSP
jgi:hypothetical protein